MPETYTYAETVSILQVVLKTNILSSYYTIVVSDAELVIHAPPCMLKIHAARILNDDMMHDRIIFSKQFVLYVCCLNDMPNTFC